MKNSKRTCCKYKSKFSGLTPYRVAHFTTQMEAARSSEPLLSYCNTWQCHNSEDLTVAIICYLLVGIKMKFSARTEKVYSNRVHTFPKEVL
jgi:NADH:ubiquinone oxidoreductase subunit E